MSVTEQFTQVATNLIAQLGYAGLAVGLIVDSMGVPIPSEVLLPLSGALVHDGRFSFVTVMIVATLSQSLGAWIAYEIGRTGGLTVVHKYGKYVLFNERELKTTQRWFEKYGAWLTFFGRCMPVIRTYIGYPAGIARMPRKRFLVATVAGSFAWSLILVYAGYVLANNLAVIDAFLHKFSLLVVGLLVVLVVWYVMRHRKHAATK